MDLQYYYTRYQRVYKNLI